MLNQRNLTTSISYQEFLVDFQLRIEVGLTLTKPSFALTLPSASPKGSGDQCAAADSIGRSKNGTTKFVRLAFATAAEFVLLHA